MWTVLLMVGCEGSELVFTGGGEVIVSLVGEGINDSFTVPGGSDDNLDELFANGNAPGDVMFTLNVQHYAPDFAESWHLRPAEDAWVYAVDNDVADFAPCGLSIRHAELMFNLLAVTGGVLQFNVRPPDDPTIGDDGATPDSLVHTPDGSGFQFDDEVVGTRGTNSTAVEVECPSGVVPATLSVRWSFNVTIQRRAYDANRTGTYQQL